MFDGLLNRFKKSKLESADVVMKWLFEELNIRVFESSDEFTQQFDYHFSYQRLNLLAKLKENEVYLCAYFMMEESEEFRNYVMEICNRFNSNFGSSFKCGCRYDVESYKIIVDVQCNFPLTARNEENKKRFEEYLEGFFVVRDSLNKDLEDDKKRFQDSYSYDVWDETNNKERSLYLVFEHELGSGKVSEFKEGEYKKARLTVQDLFSVDDFLQKENISKISLISLHDKIEDIAVSELDRYDVAESIRAERNSHENPREVSGKDYIVVVDCKDGSRYSANFYWLTSSKWSDYYNLTITKSLLLKGDVSQIVPTSFSSVYVLNRSLEHFESEIQFMINDAKDKLEAGNVTDLKEEQKALLEFLEWDVKDEIYCGLKHFYKKQYVQAIKYLEKVIAVFRPYYSSLKKKQKSVILDLYSSVGIAYASLSIYTKALYYLRFAYEEGHIIGSCEFVNCLVAIGDERAYIIVEEQMAAVSNILCDDEEFDTTSSLFSYYCLLYRHKVNLLIELGEYDAAENELENILKLDVPYMNDFVNEQKKVVSELRSKMSK